MLQLKIVQANPGNQLSLVVGSPWYATMHLFPAALVELSGCPGSPKSTAISSSFNSHEISFSDVAAVSFSLFCSFLLFTAPTKFVKYKSKYKKEVIVI